jgi:dTDP-L-rhamnose 4-epimerase
VINFYDILQREVKRTQKPIIGKFYRFGDTRHIVSNIEKLNELGWKPEVPIEESIHDYWDYLNEQTDVQDILEYAHKQMKRLDVIREV